MPPARTQRCEDDRAGIAALLGAEEDVLELDHACVGEQQRRIVAGNQRARWDHGVALGAEEFEEVAADVVAVSFHASGRLAGMLRPHSRHDAGAGSS